MTYSQKLELSDADVRAALDAYVKKQYPFLTVKAFTITKHPLDPRDGLQEHTFNVTVENEQMKGYR